MLRHTVLFSRSRATFAISSHSAANRRNRSDVSIGRPPCSSRHLRRAMQSPLKGFGPTLHKFYAPTAHCRILQCSRLLTGPRQSVMLSWTTWSGASDAFPSELITLLGAARQRGRWPCAQQMRARAAEDLMIFVGRTLLEYPCAPTLWS